MSVLSQRQKNVVLCVSVCRACITKQNFQSMFIPIVHSLWSESVDEFVNLLLFLVV